LGDGGTPANGSYDFQFLLKNAAIAGDTVGAVIRQTLSVQSGVFSTSLPLEPSSFPGANRWIEVRVRPTPAEGSAVPEETAPFAILERQRIQATPYAFRAMSAATVESVPLQSLPPGVPVLDAGGRLSISLIPDGIARTNALVDLGGVFQVALQSTNAATLAAIAALDQRQTGLSNAVALLKDGQTSHASRLAVLEAQQVYQSNSVVALVQTVARLTNAVATLERRIDVLTQTNANLQQSLEVASAPTRSGWMAPRLCRPIRAWWPTASWSFPPSLCPDGCRSRPPACPRPDRRRLRSGLGWNGSSGAARWPARWRWPTEPACGPTWISGPKSSQSTHRPHAAAIRPSGPVTR
jgi:uncharacterized coiled-coil protein SlyX